jgi:hypothetical protein
MIPVWLISCDTFSVQSVDPEGVYLMQGWLFHEGFWNQVERIEAYLSGVPNEQMMILDLNSGVSEPKHTIQTYQSNLYDRLAQCLPLRTRTLASLTSGICCSTMAGVVGCMVMST